VTGGFAGGTASAMFGVWLVTGVHAFAFLQTRSPPDSTFDTPSPKEAGGAPGTPLTSKDADDPP